MLYPSLHIATAFIYYLFRSRSCDCGCGQNCDQNYGNPNNVERFYKDCSSDCESSSSSECVTEPQSRNSSPTTNITGHGKKDFTTPTTTIHGRRRKNKPAKMIAGAVAATMTAGVSVPLIALAFFMPPLPSFALPEITVNAFDISASNVISAYFQVAISSRNSNNMFRFYFDRLKIYVTYRNQPITYSTTIQDDLNPGGQNQTGAWTANVCGTPVTLEPNNAAALCQERATGSVKVTVKIVGRVRWKFWFFPTMKHKFSVKCSAFIPIGSQQTQISVRKCKVRL